MHQRIHKPTLKTSAFAPRPFAIQAQQDSSTPPTQQTLENKALKQDNLESFRLQLKEKHGTIAPVEQQRLGVLQAKRDEWVQKQLNASKFGFNLSNITVHPPDTQAIPVQSGSNPIRRACQPRIPEARSPIQAKLTIGQPNDKYEQEADRVAAQIVRQITAPVSAQPTQQQSVQRQNGLKEKIQASLSIPALQRREAVGGGEASTNLESAINSARGGGQSLDAGLQQSMGQAMGADFSGVKVHTDSQSDQLNRSIQAKAFTTGQDVFFRQGAYQPESRSGQELIAHELTHVVQQISSLQRTADPQSHIHSEINPLLAHQIQCQDDSSQASDTPTLIVEDAITNLSQGQMKKSPFLKQLYQALYAVGTEEYQGTNLTVEGCPYIIYWFDRYREEESTHLELALRKYTSAPSTIASSEELIQLICVRARRGFKSQVKTGEVTELPEDVSIQEGEGIIPTREMIVQRKEVSSNRIQPKQVKEGSTTHIEDLGNKNVIQRGCIKGGNGGGGDEHQNQDQPRVEIRERPKGLTRGTRTYGLNLLATDNEEYKAKKGYRSGKQAREFSIGRVKLWCDSYGKTTMKRHDLIYNIRELIVDEIGLASKGWKDEILVDDNLYTIYLEVIEDVGKLLKPVTGEEWPDEVKGDYIIPY